MTDPIQAVVIDSGSGFTRAGFAGLDQPTTVIPSVVGRIRRNGEGNPAFYTGREALAARGRLNLKYPIEHGIETNWDDLELLWQDVLYNHLKVAPEEHPVMLTECPQGPKAGREKKTAIMFETFNVPAMFVALQGVLALHQSGRLTGLTVDSGDGVSHIIPVYQGYAMPHGIMRVDLGGRDITDYLMKILTDRGYSFTTIAEREIVRDVKEKLAHAALDYEALLKEAALEPTAFEKSYDLPDGSTIVVGNEAFRCAEALFQPSLLGSPALGLPNAAYYSTMKTDVELRLEMFENVLLVGGNTLFPGFVNRFTKELASLTNNPVRVLAPEERSYSAWLGGSILASLPGFQDQWLTKAEYEEGGPSAIHRKCF